MPATDLTTINDPRLYMIGAGIVQIGLIDENGDIQGYFDAGNATVVRATNSDERFLKNESRTRYRARIVDLLLRRNTDIQFDFDEWSSRLLEIWFQGTATVGAAQLGTPVTAEVVTTAVVLGSSYILAKRGPISAYTFTESYGPTVLVEGDDYVIDDNDVPVVRFLADAPNLVTGAEIEADYTPTAYTGGMTQLDIGTQSSVLAAVRFIGDPPNGPRFMYDWWKGTFRPNGSIDLINNTNENTPLSMIFSVSSDVVNHPDNPIGRLVQLPT